MASVGRLPHGVFELWAALEGGPPAAHAVCRAVMDAMQARDPRMKLNNAMRGLRRQTSQPLLVLRDWLKSGDVFRQAHDGGVYWSLCKWQSAIDKIIEGETAHKAFGCDTPGRPHNLGFTRAEQAAIYCECRRRSGVSLDEALAERNDTPDERDVRRARHELLLENASDVDLRILVGEPAGPIFKKGNRHDR